ncbi:MAG: CBS domain-containing protein [Saprospiraceae bacterium]|nr:CBS domain-containing protein [Lewinella sp.]
MDIKAPISTIMTTDLITVNPGDPLAKAKNAFDQFRIHHLLVLDDEEKLVGILSKTDLLYFLDFIDKDSQEPYLTDLRLKNYKVEEIMIKEPFSVSDSDSIKAVLEVFKENLFHALPILKGNKLVGIVTTHDVIKALLENHKLLEV